MDKVSIIVPVYNSELYVKECLESLLDQTYKNIEIILIDDGSKDKSYEICKIYAKKDCRIQLYHQENIGVSKTRNNGIEKATGKYILFVDSDDYCEAEMIENAVENVKDDMLYIWCYTEIYKNKAIPIKFSQKVDMDNLYKVFSSTLIGSSCNKIFSLDIIKKNNLKFEEDIYNAEDLLFVLTYLQFVKNIKYEEKFLYNHRIGKNIVMFYKKPSYRNMTILHSYNEILKIDNLSQEMKAKVKYEYILAYYRMKKYIPVDFKIESAILKEENNILYSKCYSCKEKIKYIIIKYFNELYKKYSLRRIKENELFE